LGFVVGIDIGGTFTDFIVVDLSTGEILENLKILSTPENPERAVIEGLKILIDKFNPNDFEFVLHATTIATNALLGQVKLELPKAVLVTTRGFRDVLEIARQNRPKLYDLMFMKPKPLIERRYRLEVSERIDAEGKIVEELNYSDLENVAKFVLDKGVKSVAICFLNSYINSIHEEMAEDFLRKRLGEEIFISPSYKVCKEFREYERTSTTVINALLKPIVSKYLNRLEKNIREILPRAKFFVMESNGGSASIKLVAERPYTIIESGPAAGVIATRFLAKQLGIKNALSFDMGGTTAKAGLVINGEALITTEYEVGGEVHAGRVVKGSGYPIRFSFIDLAEVSAGGGTIIWIDEGGGLRVGPLSAGADPGPVCYGKGGMDPTITDANLMLGRLNPEYLLGGDLRIDRELSKKVFMDKIASKLGLSLEEASIAALNIANLVMARAMRIVSLERGYDPRDLTLVAYGGAGSMHAIALAEELNIKSIIVPLTPGLFSTYGLLASNIKHTIIEFYGKKLSEIDFSDLNERIKKILNRLENVLRTETTVVSEILFNIQFDMRYVGQGFELIVPIGNLDEKNFVDVIRERFEEKHKAVYGYIMEDEEIEIVNLRIDGILSLVDLKMREIKSNAGKIDEALIDHRQVYFENEGDYIRTPVYSRERLTPRSVIQGPAIIEQYDTTIVIYPNWVANVDKYGNIIITREG